MRLILTFVLFFTAITSNVRAQQDTIYVTIDSSENQNFNRDKKYKYIDQNLLKRRTLYKYGVHVNSSENKDRISVEHKIWPSLSMEMGVLLPSDEQIGVFGKLRYYPRKRINAPESIMKINNFNGQYFSIEANKGFEFDIYENSRDFTAEERAKGVYSLGFGMQEKVGNWGFFDLSANLRYFKALDQLSIGLKLMTGLAYGGTSSADLYLSNKYEEFKTNYRKENQLFKLQDPGLFLGKDFASASLSFGYERTLFQNFSINSILNFSVANNQNTPNEYSAYIASLSSEVRYYYNFKRRIRLGHNPKTFSGHYFGLGVNSLLIHRRTSLDIGDSFSRNRLSFNDLNGLDVAVIQASWGTQQRIGKRGFFDLGGGVVYRTYDQSFGLELKSSLGITLGK